MASQKKYTWILIICAIIVAIMIFFEPSYGWRIRAWLGAGSTISQADDSSLIAENESLKAQLAVLQNVADQLPQNEIDKNEIHAMVYSQYPFGFRNELLVNAGSNEGVVSGKAVAFDGVFVGIISKVFSNSAVVDTVFDVNFKMPVRVGSKGYDGLFVGGPYPKVTSIAKDSEIATGDIVYTAAPNLPYGLPISTVNATNISADNLFQEATVGFAYDINGVQSVSIEQ